MSALASLTRLTHSSKTGANFAKLLSLRAVVQACTGVLKLALRIKTRGTDMQASWRDSLHRRAACMHARNVS